MMNERNTQESDQKLRALLALKRYEKPAADFESRFLADFQKRQRQELVNHSSRSLLWERIETYFSFCAFSRWQLAGAICALAVTATGLLQWRQAQHQPNSSHVTPLASQNTNSENSGVTEPVLLPVSAHRILPKVQSNLNFPKKSSPPEAYMEF